ncbi:MAG: C-GCAxxG-C-C family protein [Eubacteriales bacterium]|nr:C-GCAxxG-C-C family protein [Eubacteriales bacterium]
MDLYEKIIEYAQQGYHCSQIIMQLALETAGKEEPELVRALGGLGGGIGYTGDTCGCLTGGACTISYFLGKEAPDIPETQTNKEALRELVSWFKEELGPEIGGSVCTDICHLDRAMIIQKCPEIIGSTYEKCMDILIDKGAVEA